MARPAGAGVPLPAMPETVFLRAPKEAGIARGGVKRSAHKREPTKIVSKQTTSEAGPGVARKPSPWLLAVSELQALDESFDLVSAIQQLLRVVQKTVPEHSAGIFLLDEQTQTVQGQVTDLFDRELNVGHGSLPELFRQNVPYVISDLGERRRAHVPVERIRSQIVVPFRLTGDVRGALLLRSRESGAYSNEDGEALARFARAASARIENALIRQKMLRLGETEVDRDMVMAQEIMARLIPRQAPQVPGFEVGSAYIPAKIVGGDLLNFISLPDEHYGFLVADAAGNGVPAALLMTGFRAMFRGLIINNFNIRSVFHKANNQLLEGSAPHQFVSAFYGQLDAVTNRLIYVNGGHVPPLLIRAGQPVRQLDVGGPVLGILAGASYHEDSVVMQPQDILVCFSDGLSEAENAAGEVFDAYRIQAVVEALRSESARAICIALQEEAGRFAGESPRDDLTLCVLKRLEL
jgi:sigma-B regulation protein RsbU (phosphoserine phosphatase)